MAHEVESMFYVGKEPWHGLGVPIPQEKKLSIREGISAAGLDWAVEMRRLYSEDQHGQRIGIMDTYATVRSKDNQVLGIVGPAYVPLQNEEAFSWFQPFLDAGAATLETAGSLKHGRKVWILAKIRDGQAALGDDKIDHFILLSNSHDGSLPVRVGFTPIRVVCNNTLCMAHASRASKLLQVKHTARVMENLASIQRVMELARREFYATIDQFKRLRNKKIDNADLERYVRIVFDLGDRPSDIILPKVLHLFEKGRGSDLAGNTLWGGYNAVTEYLNYFRGKTQDNTLDSLWHGGSALINRRALEVGLRMAV